MKPEVNKELIGTCNANSHGLALVRSFLFLKAVIKAIFAGTDFFFFFFPCRVFCHQPNVAAVYYLRRPRVPNRSGFLTQGEDDSNWWGGDSAEVVGMGMGQDLWKRQVGFPKELEA